MSADPTAFFALERHDPAAPCRPPWRPMRELARPSPAWAHRIDATQSALAAASRVSAVERRVAASVTQLGLCARVIAPALAAAVEGRSVDMRLDALRWQPVLGGPFPLSAPAGDPGVADTGVALHRDLVPTVTAFVDTAREYSVSPIVGWGNVASALHSSAGLLAAHRPDAAGRTRAIVAELVELMPLADAGDADEDGRFRRRSCCLIYRAAPGPPSAVCGDCVLHPLVTTRRLRGSRR